MTEHLDLRVTEMLCSRICHDLVSPVGAINNGVELLEEIGRDVAEEATGLIAQSGRRAAARLRAFRLAYGSGGAQAIGYGETRETAAAFVQGSKLALSWPQPLEIAPLELPVGGAKLLICMVMLGEEALTHGGRLTLIPETEGAPEAVELQGEGRVAVLPTGGHEALAGTVGVEELTARTVHGYMTGRMAAQYGMRLVVQEDGPGRIRMRLAWGNQ